MKEKDMATTTSATATRTKFNVSFTKVQNNLEKVKEFAEKNALDVLKRHLKDDSDAAALMSESADTKENRFKKFLAKGKFNDLDEAITAPNFRYNIGGVDCVPEGEIVAVSGKPGAGKSTALAILIGISLGNAEFVGIRCLQRAYKVLWLDTEKGPYSCKQKMSNFRMVAGIGRDRPLEDVGIDFYLIREERREDLIYFIRQLAEMAEYDTFILDGIIELTDDPNEHTAETIDLLKWLAGKGAVVFAMLHTNKGDDNMRYALGSELQRICTTRIDVTFGKGLHTLHCGKTNDTMPFPDFSFAIDKEGRVIDPSLPIVDVKKVLQWVFDDGQSREWGKLRRDFASKAGVPSNLAFTLCQQAQKDGLLVQELDGNINLKREK